ncbi:proton-conducting transporter membrane subunit [Ornithinimicrobium sp. W1665]|uniref:proton-conducting transporter transmembrane domain-containing protein n=1 Tax=Ornithinimicrobium sp. W1665 TaxID=3416666 RepID=UPI003CE84834
MNLELDLVATLPVLAPLVAAVLVLLLDAAVPGRREPHLLLAAGGLAAGALGTWPGLRLGAGDRRGAFCLPTGECLYTADRLTSVLQLTALLGALVVLVLAWDDWRQRSVTGRAPVVAALVLGATAGAAAVPAAGDLGTLLVSLELATLPTVALVVLADPRWTSGHRAGAVDGAVALLTTSLVSFGLMALGAALWVAATGTALLTVPTSEETGLLVVAAVLLLAGLAFKVSAVPFHAWTPVTYTRAPLPVTAYLATVSKVAALGGLVVLVRALGTVDGTTLVAVALLAALSMTVGNLVALGQVDTVRLLAWSTVAQAGWVLLPLAGLSSRAVHAAGSYLVVYVLGTLLALVVVVAVARAGAADPVAAGPGTALAAHQGLVRRRPLLGLPLALALLTLAGLPPAVLGLVAKIVALRPVAAEGTWWLAVVAAVNVALGIAVYVRWIAVLLQAPDPARPTRAAAVGSTEGAVGSAGDGSAEDEDAGDGDAGDGGAGRTGAGDEGAGDGGGAARTVPVREAVLVGALTAVVVVGSIAPFGVL